MEKKKQKVLLYGIGTYKNKGVEAIVQSTLNQIDMNKYEVSAASHDYDYNKTLYNKEIKKYIKHYKKSDELNEEEKELEKKYQNMPFDYNNFELLYQNEVVKEIEKSDICISVGGDNYCYDFCTWLYALDKKSHDLNKKTVLWGVSLFEEINDLELINNLNNFDVIVTRESLSYEAIKKCVPEERILFRPDPAFSLEKKEVKLNSWYKNKEFVILNFSPLTIEREEQYIEVKNLIDYILKKTKYSICLLPHVVTDDCNDLEILNKIKEDYKKENRIYLEKNSYNCNELKYIISKAQILVAARTHASIAAYSTGVPTLVIGYSVKSKGIAKDIFGDYENYVISKNNLKNNNLIEKFKFIDSNQEKIKKTLANKMPEFREKASNLWNELLQRLEEVEKMKICPREKCIGCGICSKKCPKNAITMQEDEDGFVYPHLDLKKCIECDLCRNICPINSKKEEQEKDNEYYAAKSKDEKAKEKSSSGGIFSVLATTMLSKKGIVYGCQMSNFEAKHIRIDAEKDLDKIRGSKYIQSSIIDVLEEVKKDLENNKEVLFSGTPCQIGALKNYLQKDYSNLLTVSVICHGITNHKILEQQIKEIENKECVKIKNVNFRAKENGWTKASIKYEAENNMIVNKFIEDDLMELYLKELIIREGCFYCKYKGKNNEADIILGDYWGIEVTNKEFWDEKGVSALIVNSKKGKRYLEKNKIFDKIEYCNGDFENIVKYNPNLTSVLSIPSDRKATLYSIKKYGIEFTNLKRKYALLEKDLAKKSELTELLREENQFIADEIFNMRNSRRWKIVDKLVNIFNRILRRSR